MKFAFLAHPLSQEHRALMAVDKSGRLRQSWGGDIFQFCQLLHQNMNSYQATGLVNEDEVRVVDEFSGLVSGQGKVCDGRFYEIPMDAQQILEQPNHALALMEQAVDDAAEWGAEIVGLGSMTGIVGSHGQHLAERGPVAVTTGNSLTVYSATQNLKRACELTGIELRNETVAVVGIPGSIGMALAKLLAPLCKSLICVARTDSVRARNLAASLDSQLSTSIPEALKSAKIVMSATSSGDCIDQNWLMPGSLVIDVAVPTDVIGSQAIRDDILILTGGMLMTPKTMSRESKFIGFNHGMVPSCFGETMTLALEDRRECFSIGKNLSIEGITEIGAIANGHGFDFSNLSCFGVPVSSQQITRFQKSVYRNQRITQVAAPHYSTTQPTPDGPHANGHANGHATNGHATNGQAKKGHAKKGAGSGHEHYIAQRPEDLSELAIDRYKRFVNPVLVALGEKSGFLKTFVKGEGCYVWDHAGQKFLDFVSGFGSLNLGHNHPVVTAALTTALAAGAPGFAQSAVNPYAAALADRLVSCSPSELEMVSFANSGAEAIEAAIKLVKITSDRKKVLYCRGSYHGKTLGALSLTGNQKFQEPFGPLIGGMDAVDFGDSSQLEDALRSNQYSAFFVEPIQCEGGMRMPPPGYLNDVESICRATETLFVLDEVQTGLGRTGKMFCADHFGISPDIMTLAKSLGGGLVPSGAMLCRQDLWMKAYGSVENFALHSSTFAGGSLAMAAGLATMEVLEKSTLIENCELRSVQLLDGLRTLASQTDLIADVRGLGLLIGVEFNQIPNNIVRHFAAHDTTGIGHFLAPRAIDAVRNLAPIYVMQTLMDGFGIYTQIARSNPTVLRVQPPLGVTESQVSEFLNGLRVCCEELSFSNRITDTMIAKSTFGNSDKKQVVNG